MLRIRLARPSDLRHLAGVEAAGIVLYEAVFGEALHPVLRTPPPSGGARADKPGFLLVAEDDGRVVGFAHVLDLDGHAHLEQLSVLPEHGRRGIGSALVRAAMEEARWAGYDALSLCTYRDVPFNGPFYAGLGFTEVDALLPFQASLHAYELAVGLGEDGVRVVMSAPLRHPVTGG